MDEPHRRRELATLLRARRHGTTPAQVGLPNGGRRKTPGLRREEVAQLSGVGLTWYTWLGEGRARILLAQFRAAAGRQAGDPRFAELIDALNHASLEFRTWWPRYQAADFARTEHKIRHPRLGPVTLELSQLSLGTHPSFIIVPADTANVRRQGEARDIVGA